MLLKVVAEFVWRVEMMVHQTALEQHYIYGRPCLNEQSLSLLMDHGQFLDCLRCGKPKHLIFIHISNFKSHIKTVLNCFCMGSN